MAYLGSDGTWALRSRFGSLALGSCERGKLLSAHPLPSVGFTTFMLNCYRNPAVSELVSSTDFLEALPGFPEYGEIRARAELRILANLRSDVRKWGTQPARTQLGATKEVVILVVIKYIYMLQGPILSISHCKNPNQHPACRNSSPISQRKLKLQACTSPPTRLTQRETLRGPATEPLLLRRTSLSPSSKAVPPSPT